MNLPIDAQLAAKAVKPVADYAGAAEQAASFVEDDAFNATMFMTDAEQKFAAAQQDVSTLVTTAMELEGALDEQMIVVEHSSSGHDRGRRRHGGAAPVGDFDLAQPDDLTARSWQ